VGTPNIDYRAFVLASAIANGNARAACGLLGASKPFGHRRRRLRPVAIFHASGQRRVEKGSITVISPPAAGAISKISSGAEIMNRDGRSRFARPVVSSARRPDQVGIVELFPASGTWQPLAWHIEVSVAQTAQRMCGQVTHPLRASDPRKFLGWPESFNFEGPVFPSAGLQGAISCDRPPPERVNGHSLTISAPRTVRRPDPGNADAVFFHGSAPRGGGNRHYGGRPFGAAAAGFWASWQLPWAGGLGSSPCALLRGTARSGLLRAGRLAARLRAIKENARYDRTVLLPLAEASSWLSRYRILSRSALSFGHERIEVAEPLDETAVARDNRLSAHPRCDRRGRFLGAGGGAHPDFQRHSASFRRLIDRIPSFPSRRRGRERRGELLFSFLPKPGKPPRPRQSGSPRDRQRTGQATWLRPPWRARETAGAGRHPRAGAWAAPPGRTTRHLFRRVFRHFPPGPACRRPIGRSALCKAGKRAPPFFGAAPWPSSWSGHAPVHFEELVDLLEPWVPEPASDAFLAAPP